MVASGIAAEAISAVHIFVCALSVWSCLAQLFLRLQQLARY